jgi:hypothetical protein
MGHGSHAATYVVGTGIVSSGVKRSRRETDSLLLSSYEVEWSSASAHGAHVDNCSVTLHLFFHAFC